MHNYTGVSLLATKWSAADLLPAELLDFTIR
jgi:hypothetical protein